MHRAETGARCPLSCVTNDNLLRSQMMQVRSREPLTTMRYADDAVRHVTASVWPSSACNARKHKNKRVNSNVSKKIWLTYDVEVKNGIVLDFTVAHKAECEQLLSLLISLVKILNGDFSRQWCLYLFEHKWFSPLLGGSCLPHTDGSAGATGDNQLRVWAYGTNDLTPFWQTFVYHQCLKVRMRPEVIKVAD